MYHQNLCQWLNRCKNVPETIQIINIKNSNFEKQNGLNFKLKHRKAQKSILSRRLGDPYGRAEDQCHISGRLPDDPGELLAYMRLWTSNAAPVACLFQNNGDVSARDYAYVMLIYDELLLTKFKPPLLNDHLLVPWGWPLNRGSTVFTSSSVKKLYTLCQINSVKGTANG